jgi:hypothetical protein
MLLIAEPCGILQYEEKVTKRVYVKLKMLNAYLITLEVNRNLN